MKLIKIRNVAGYENVKDFYYVSECGDVFSSRLGALYKMRQSRYSNGYLFVGVMTVDSGTVKRQIMVHRIVASAFIQNADALPEVNHKDEDKHNNAVSNLEWCSPAYNRNYGTCRERSAQGHMKPVEQLDAHTGKLVSVWPSVTHAAKSVGAHKSVISGCCRGRTKTAIGYVWRFCNG